MKIIETHEFHVPNPQSVNHDNDVNNTVCCFHVDCLYCRELKKQKFLENYLCQALKVQRNPEGEISVLKAKGYVLTVDYLLKMIGVHERQQCGMPVVISGETGVGKTFLLETLSELYNYSLHKKLDYWRNKLQTFLNENTSIQGKNEEEIKSSLSSDDRVKSLNAVFTWINDPLLEAQDLLEVFSLIEFDSVKREIPNEFSEEVFIIFIYIK